LAVATVAKRKTPSPKPEADAPSPPPAGFQAAPADGGLSIDKLAQAFAAMMGTGDPYAQPSDGEDVVKVDASPVLDDDDGFASSEGDASFRVCPESILEAILFVGLPGGEAITSRTVAGLMRGVRPQEIDELAADMRRRYRADNCPYEVVAKDAGWVMRLRPEFARFGSVVEARSRTVRLDAEALDVLALVAWNQPVKRNRIVELGCDARPTVWRQLVQRGLLELVHDEAAHEGHDTPTEPSYRTTRKFLEVFRLESIDDLPEPTEPPR
jgi:segregation and condensation protein B